MRTINQQLGLPANIDVTNPSELGATMLKLLEFAGVANGDRGTEGDRYVTKTEMDAAIDALREELTP